MKRTITVTLCLLLIASVIVIPSNGSALRYTMDKTLSSVDASFWGEDIADNSGMVIAFAGDVNGDGYDDILIGAPADEEGGNNAGQTYLIFGKATGWAMDKDLSAADASFWGENANDYSGSSIAGVGDVNGDGFDDILIGAPYSTVNQSMEGKAYLIFGRSTGWTRDTDLSLSNASFYGEEPDNYAGWAIAGVGDVNGDGFDDMLLGAPSYDGESWFKGKTYLLFGKASGWAQDTNLSGTEASFVGENLGDSSGSAVAGAGDVNGDGLDDFLIGAYLNDEGGDAAGQTYLFFGNTTGWDNDTNLSKADASFWGENPSDVSGFSLAGAGDVNGDGFNDILIGAYGNCYSGSQAGQTYLIFGNSSGWSMDTDLSASNASFTGEGANHLSGRVIAGTGNVNGDGFEDILIGAPWNPEVGAYAGQTYLLLGKQSGWAMHKSLSTANASFRGESANDISGYAVAGGADVNGDSYDDILIGAYADDDGGTDAGQTYLIFPDLNSKPTAIAWIDTYTDVTFSNKKHNAFLNETVFVTLGGTDGNAAKVDMTKVYIRSNISDSWGFTLFLRESGKNTGLYRGNFTLRARTHEFHRWINTTMGELINIRSIQDLSINRTITVGLAIFPHMAPDNFVLEDEPIEIHFWSTGPQPVTWDAVFSNMVFHWDNVTNNLSGRPLNTDVGFFTQVDITLSYKTISSVSDTFYIQVNNTLPKILPTDNPIIAYEDQSLAIDLNSTDDGQGTIKWAMDTDAGEWLDLDPNTGLLYGMPSNDDLGKYYVDVKVDDGNWGTGLTHLNLTVVNTNDPPTIVGQSKYTAYEDALYWVQYQVSDIDLGDTHTWSLSTNTGDWLGLNASNGNLSGTPLNDDVGTYWVNITVIDSAQATAYRNFTVTVKNVNDPPVLDKAGFDLNLTNGTKFEHKVNATDEDLDPLVYTLQGGLYGLVLSENGTVTWQPFCINKVGSEEKCGDFTVLVLVSDGTVSVTQTLNILVFERKMVIPPPPVNRLPLITSHPSYNSKVNETYTYAIIATDPDGEALSYSFFAGCSGQAVNWYTDWSVTGNVLTMVPVKASKMAWCIEAHVSDGHDISVQSWFINVTEPVVPPPSVNHPPVIHSKCTITQTNPPTHYRVGATLKCIFDAVDLDDDTLTWTITGAEGLSYIPTPLHSVGYGNLTWTPTKAGTYTLRFNVTDGKGGFDEKTTTISIEPKKKEPVSSMGATQIATIITVIVAAIGLGLLVLFFKQKKAKKKPTRKRNKR
jgi:hypothetical protein